MIRVKIISDKGVSRIVDADTGEVIKGVVKVEIVHQEGALPIIELSLVVTDVGQYGVQGDASIMVMSTVAGEMKAVESIEFEDGEIINYGEPV